MSRLALLALAALLVGGCQKTPEQPVDSPGGSVAGTERAREADGRSPSSYASHLAAERSSAATSLIAVATTSASEAQPCERLCGSLGDCLLASDYASTAASGLELSCLDMCVHAPDSASAKTEFLACGSQTECGPLQACAERSWAALAAAHHSPEVSGVIATADRCKDGCRWIYSCMTFNQPPDAAELDPASQQYVNECIHGCDTARPEDYEYLSNMPECLADRCSLEGLYYCFEQLSK